MQRLTNQAPGEEREGEGMIELLCKGKEVRKYVKENPKKCKGLVIREGHIGPRIIPFTMSITKSVMIKKRRFSYEVLYDLDVASINKIIAHFNKGFKRGVLKKKKDLKTEAK